jgi:TM2 domain-containing membrane protein YozV
MNPEPTREIAVVREIHYVPAGPNPGTAVVLEVLPGLLLQTFGIGNLYAGNIATGILVMLLYWGLLLVNVLLCYLLIGFLTLPLTWIGFAILSSMMAHSGARRRSLGR